MEEDNQTPLLLGRPFLNTARAVIEVHKGKISFKIAGETITFQIGRAMQYPSDNSPICKIDLIDELVQETMLEDLRLRFGEIGETPKEIEQISEIGVNPQSQEAPLQMKNLEETAQTDDLNSEHKGNLDKIISAETFPLPPEIPDETPKLELKPLPPSLRYEFLGDKKTYPVIINSALDPQQTEKLLTELRKHRGALGYTLNDIKGINPSFCMHRILMEENHKPNIEAQRRLNPNLSEVVWKEIHKLLDAGIIYPISDSKWVSPIHVVPKKGGTTVIKNEAGEAIATRMVTGWRMCIDYRKLNSGTRKDHFPLPFIDQLLERMPFGLYNPPAH